EGGEVSEEYREAFGEHAYDEEGNYIGFDYAEGEFTPETEAQAAWADFAEEIGTPVHHPEAGAEGPDAEAGESRAADAAVATAGPPSEAPAEAAPAEPAAEPAPEG
ncbi:MAG TPA: 30S ribosomal protein S1, partial [Acidimicrobiales bacterium]|nr:30S ribosomal protein S1 [Acidimicrobiales bacterium]